MMSETETPAPTAVNLPMLTFEDRDALSKSRCIASETAVAISYAGSTHAVMMATPADLVDFAYGFSLTEGIIVSASEIVDLAVEVFDQGIDIQISLREDRSQALVARRRSMAGPVGCGLCGLESLSAAMRNVPSVGVGGFAISPQQIDAAVNALGDAQPLFAQTRAVHGAGFWREGEGIVAVREDVGRHNALDKLIGALALKDQDCGNGAIVVTSRLSVEMVQKAAIAGAPVLIAISAPTELAIRTAEQAGITLVALARGDGFSVFTHAERILTA